MEHYVFTVPHGAKVEIKYEERRDPDREMYQYKTSADPRIRALERRGGIPGRIIEIGSGRSVRDRRVATGPRRVDLVSCREYPLKAGRRWGLCDRRKP